MASNDEETAIAASIAVYLQEEIQGGHLNMESRESLAVARDCIRNVYKVTGSEKTVPLDFAFRSALKLCAKARESFIQAASLEPDNETYHNNIKVVTEKIDQEERARRMGADLFSSILPPMPAPPGGDTISFLNDPNFMSMASRVMQDPNMQQMLSSVVGNLVSAVRPPGDGADSAGPGTSGGETGQSGDEFTQDFTNILRVGQQLANQISSAHPELIEELRRVRGEPPVDESRNPEGN
ncbi:unnamed protein product [Notodromas monacha]|uniref:SGTA homodimerisation domain-containing protein n=1 Tax=Notodromas monacha TaxID=399045 RepID=A0A7R9BGZ6_9CRUS|nr:unnamed protein product [Notodromas monacha]CAG0915139.1 unnamed protein product [Notodromas monacha]